MTRTKDRAAPARDVYRFINELDAETVQGLVARLEFRGRDPTFGAWRGAYLDALELPAAARVLELGCGTGVVARALASRPGFAGRIVGIDQSPALIEAGLRLAEEEGIGQRVELDVGDVAETGLAGSSFDAVVAHTLVSHVASPVRVLREAARLLATGGRLVVFDGDYASLTFSHPDPALARAMEEGLIAVLVDQPRVMRELASLLPKAGLALVDARAHAYADIGASGFFLNMAEAYGPLVGAAGILPEEQVLAWIGHQREAAADGTFFGACNYFTYMARRS